MVTTESILEKLISFDTTSRNPNLALIDYIADLLEHNGIESVVIKNDEKTKANLYATIGPLTTGGVMLLKGFVACAIASAIRATKQTLTTPLHLAFSYDEEIGCVGVHSLLDMLNKAPIKPAMCIVGEPTLLQVATKHKGKTAIIAHCSGTEGHSAMAPNFQNAIHLACDLVEVLRDTQAQIADASNQSDNPNIPYTTVHVSRIHAGQALNIVPNLCSVNFEIRHPATDDPVAILKKIKQRADQLVHQAQQRFPEVGIEFETLNTYPALDTPINSEVVQFVQSLLDTNDTSFVAFGTEGGYAGTTYYTTGRKRKTVNQISNFYSPYPKGLGAPVTSAISL